MRLIVDTNAILSGLLKKGLSREIIQSELFEFYTIPYAFEEIEKYKDFIIVESKLEENELSALIRLFKDRIKFVPEKDVLVKMNEALKIMRAIDIKDAPILACALTISNDGIWSQDRHFEKQNVVKAWKTLDLIKFIGKCFS